MHKVFAVIRREYSQAIKTKAFWIGTAIFPLMMVFMFGLSAGAQLLSPQVQKRVAVVDATGELGEPIAGLLAGHTLTDDRPEFLVEQIPLHSDVDATRQSLEPRILEGDLHAILTIGDDLDAEGNFKLYRKSVGDEGTARTIRRALTDAAIGHRLERSELDVSQDELEALVEPVELKSYQVTEGETRQKGFEEVFLATFGFVLMLFFTLYFYGFAITRGIIQEKSNRVIEVLLGSLSSDQLITGKILGIGLVGVTQVTIYALVGGGVRVAFGMLASGDLSLGSALATPKLIAFVLFFLLGYFLFATLFAIVGAVCNTEQDAQSLQFPLMLSLMVPYIATFFFVRHPDSLVTVITSFIPLFTPMVMFMRISVLTPPLWQIVLSVLLMLVTIYGMFRVAAKVFRIGTLMHGKRPTIPEIWRWARS